MTFLVAALLLAQEPGSAESLAKIKRIYVDKLTGGPAADQIRDMLMSSLQGAKLWTITENPERADAFLRGAAEDFVYAERRSSRDSIGARGSVSDREGGFQGSQRPNTRDDRSASFGINAEEGTSILERKHEASAAIRLVNRDGDLIWSTTKESAGAKFKGPSADVADRVTRQLIEDFRAAKGLPPETALPALGSVRR